MITGGDEVCILPPPTLSEKGVGIPTFCPFLNMKTPGREYETVQYLPDMECSSVIRYFQHAHFIPIVGVGKREAHINWSMVTCQGSTRLEMP